MMMMTMITEHATLRYVVGNQFNDVFITNIKMLTRTLCNKEIFQFPYVVCTVLSTWNDITD